MTRKTLILIFSGIGNAITALPIIEILNKNNFEVDILVKSNVIKELLFEDPRISNVYIFNPKKDIFKSLKIIKQLRNKNYDFAMTIYPSQGIISGFILYLINAKIRTQHVCNYLLKFISMKFKIPIPFKKDIILFEKFFLTHPKNVKEEKHAVYQMLDLLNPIIQNHNQKDLDLKFYLNDDETSFAERFWTENNLNDKFVIGIHTGTSNKPPFKMWDLEYWKQLLIKINEKYNVDFIVFIGPSEEEHEKYLKSLGLDNLIIAKNLSIRKTIALISKCNFFISADSGLAHCASLFKIPQIVMFGPVDYKYIHPFSENCKVVVPDNYKPFYIPHCGFISKPYDCMKDLKPEKVFKEFEEYLKDLGIYEKLKR
ncbi:glycosyltransferase family 9 protein [Methanotorris formicicus]|uniref:Glycosyl transferase family 9 n=1 Tax=Methanotorris formicicus Mc-S-70 TaxID=647171 RepID=H1L0E5_9EURY|nr:glycosyltransferase family 9 protein [Methanotorris formicicus]EHP84939.1 glycosyl transferase family 9 [Methanotorris formicicus Mc-S-70]